VTQPLWATNAVRCLAVAAGERLAVVVDEPLIDAGLRVCDAANEIGAQVSMSVLPDSSRPIAMADAPFVASLSEVDAVLLWLSRTTTAEFGTHRQPIYQRAQSLGTRVAFGAEIDDDILRYEMSADYEAMQVRCAAMAARLETRRLVRVTTPAGTDCTFDLEGRSWLIDDGRIDSPSAFGNLPGGEVYIAPLRTGAEGVCVIDCSIAVEGLGILEHPIRLTFREGRIVDVAGGSEADRVRTVIEQAGSGADIVAELGIGTNDQARLTGRIITDEKVLGTAHVAFGHNKGSYGGDNEATIHIDGVMADASIWIDGELAIERGTLVS
jgi:leucyl aminopeptidase (aminopeptidase T)